MRSETQSGPVAKYATSRSSDGIKPAPCGSLDQRSLSSGRWFDCQLKGLNVFRAIGQVNSSYIH